MKFRKYRSILSFILGLIFISSCEKVTISPPQINQSLPISFKNDIIPIFNTDGCNGSGCHSSVAPILGLDLTPDNAYNSLINKNQIDTASPELSILYIKINTGGSMANYLHSPTDKDKILTWIKQGAKNN